MGARDDDGLDLGAAEVDATAEGTVVTRQASRHRHSHWGAVVNSRL
jgi:hypothetical protein